MNSTFGTGESETGRQAAAAAADQQARRCTAKLRLDLYTGASLSFDDPGIAEGVNEDCAAFFHQLCRHVVPVLARAVIQNDFRAQSTGRFQLHLWSVARHHNRGCNPETTSRPGDALRMVARGNGDHAARLFRVIKVRKPPPAPADLERADGLQAFRFHMAANPADFDRQQRGRRQDSGDRARCGKHAVAIRCADIAHQFVAPAEHMDHMLHRPRAKKSGPVWRCKRAERGQRI